ncbi:hypothetical protein GCM10023063_41380 [Arthrobacter methylotrophus]
MTTAAVRIPSRPLPRPVRVYKDETTPSIIRRLGTANSLQPRQLRTLLKSSRRPWLETLAVLANNDPAVLVLAMPQLGQHDPAPSLRQKLAGRPIRTTHTAACHRCALAHGAGRYVQIYTTHEMVICPRHGLWTGEGVAGFTDQFSIRAAPEITAAWHHHKNLITSHGRSTVRKAFHVARVINWTWYDQLHHFPATTGIYDELAADQPRHANSHAIVAASLYPAIVTLTAAISSPHWDEIAHSRHPDQFLDRISIELTDGWHPRGASDPLRHWMDTDWLPGFRGPDTISPPKP